MRDEPRRRCPFLETPCPECYVSHLTSATIERAILYCGGNYETCEIYRGIVSKGWRRPAGVSEGAAESPGDASAPPNTERKRNSG